MSAVHEPWIGLLADWSVRWGVLILALMAASAVGLPRTIAARLWLGRLVLMGGLFLPLGPRWWSAPWTSQSRTASGSIARQLDNDTSIASSSELNLASTTQSISQPLHTDLSPTATTATGLIAMDWQVVATVVWCAGCGCFLARLAAGWWWLGRIRRSATPLQGPELLELQLVRAELGVGRRVELFSSANAAGPVLMVGWPSAIVVPADWSSWSEQDRRAVLLHELAHVHGWDDWCGIVEQIVRAVFFFHPLVCWLLSWLARQREQRCDAVVVSQGFAQADVARLLLAGIRRIGPGRALFPVTPMFNRSSAKERINRLLETDRMRWSKPLTFARAIPIATAVVALWAVLAGYGAKAEHAPKEVALSQFQGTVSDPDGRRVAGATVLAVGDVGRGERLTTTTDAEGRFSFGALPVAKSAFPSVFLYVVKVGFGPHIHLVIDPTKLDSVDLKLPAAIPFTGVVQNKDGAPVAGAEVQVGYVHRSKSQSVRSQCWGYQPPVAIRGTAAEPFFFAVSDQMGQFRFAALPADSELIFRVSAKGFGDLDTGAGGPKESQVVVKTNAAPAKLTLGPEAIIRGLVISRAAGVSPDVAVVTLTGGGELHGFERAVKPAADGRFEAQGLPAGPFSVSLELPPDVPATAAGVVVTTVAGQTADVNLEMISGVEVTGRVVLRDFNEPVPGVWMATNGLVNPTGTTVGAKPTDAKGQFTLRLPRGKIDVYIWRTSGDYRQIDGGRQKIDVPADVKRFEMPEPFLVGKVGTAPVPTDAATQINAGPIPVAAEVQAASLIRQHGGWYTLDGGGHVIEVNMVYHENPGGKRTDNRLIDSDGALRAVSQLPKLKRLFLTRRQATDEGLAAVAGLKELETLMIWDADAVTDVGIAHMAGLPKLRNVHISNGAIGDGSLAAFAQLPSIEKLSLQGNNFSDAGLNHLAGLKQLRTLWIGMNKQSITDAGAQHLVGLENLETLDLQNSRLTPACVAGLRRMKNLKSLYLDGTDETNNGAKKR